MLQERPSAAERQRRIGLQKTVTQLQRPSYVRSFFRLVTLAMAVAALSCGTDDSPVEPVPEDTTGVPKITARLSVLSGDSQIGYTDELLAAPVVVVAHDSLDNPVLNQALSCSVSAGGTVSAPPTNAGGESSVEWKLGLPLGEQSLNCSAGTATVAAGASATDSLLAFVDNSTGGREIFIWRPRDSSFVRVTFGANVFRIFGWLSHDRLLYYDGQVKTISLSGSGSTVVIGQLPCPGNVTWTSDLSSWYYPGRSLADNLRCAIFNFVSITGQERQLRTAPTHNPALHPGGAFQQSGRDRSLLPPHRRQESRHLPGAGY